MTTIVTRAGKGAALTWAEGDANFENLNNAKLESENAGTEGQVLTKTATGAAWSSAAGGEVVNDTTPQLGGDLDVNGYKIVSNTNGDINLSPDGTGKIVLGTTLAPRLTGVAGALDITSGSGVAIGYAADGGSVIGNSGARYLVHADVASVLMQAVDASANTSQVYLDSGAISISSGNGDVNLTPNNGRVRAQSFAYDEGSVYVETYSATITPDVYNGNVQEVTLTGDVTFSAFSNPVAGQSLTLIVKQDSTGSRLLTSTMKFAGGDKTLSTAANAVDIISVFFDGTNYWASLGKDFK